VFENGSQDNAGAWICHEFPDIHWIRSNYQTYCYGGPAGDGAADNHGRAQELGPHTWQPYAYSSVGQHQWALEHIKGNHGPLGALWPIRQFQNGNLSFLEGGGTVPWLSLLNKGMFSSDQWGNITAGIALCRKKLGRTVYGLTLPLITNADGSKFGKTVAGAVWLDAKNTSVYRFCQFWINTDDRDVIRYLKYFTFLSREEIEALEKNHGENLGGREAHRALAKAVTDLIHGEAATQDAIRASQILFGGELEGVSEATFNDVVGEAPTKEIEKAKLSGAGAPLVELLVHAGLCPSKGQARKDIEGGGVYVNNGRQAGWQRAVTSNDLLFGKHLLLRKGKKNYVVVTAK